MEIFENAAIRFIPKGTILLHRDEICRFGCKVIRGCLKSYLLDKSGKEHILQFAPEGWLITDMESLYNQTPAHLFIEAVEDSEVYWIQRDMMDVWQNSSNQDLLEHIRLLTRNIISANKRTRMLLSSTGKERYLDFLKTYPTLTQRLPLRLIASFIGVTPEYLSEIRRSVAGK